MSVYVKPTIVIETRLQIQKGGYWHKELANSCMLHMSRFVPKDTGELRRKAYVDVVGTEVDVVYPGDYAWYQYKGVREDGTHRVNPENYSEPGTGPYWDKRMASADMSEIVKEIQDRIEGK